MWLMTLPHFISARKATYPADTVVSTALQADTANLLLLLGKAQIVYSLRNILKRFWFAHN